MLFQIIFNFFLQIYNFNEKNPILILRDPGLKHYRIYYYFM